MQPKRNHWPQLQFYVSFKLFNHFIWSNYARCKSRASANFRQVLVNVNRGNWLSQLTFIAAAPKVSSPLARSATPKMLRRNALLDQIKYLQKFRSCVVDRHRYRLPHSSSVLAFRLMGCRLLADALRFPGRPHGGCG
jgi:hypothetical protein